MKKEYIKQTLKKSPKCETPYGDDCGYCYDCVKHQEELVGGK